MKTDQKILITGANGFIGKYLSEFLLRKKFELHLLIRNDKKIPKIFLKNERIRVFIGDLSNSEVLEKAAEGVDVVVHLAASLTTFEKNGELFQSNIAGLKNILNACKTANRPIKFIFASSIDAEKKESDYGKSKLEGEEIIKFFSLSYPRVRYTILRFGNVYEKEGIIKTVKDAVSKNNWQSSVLYNLLGNRHLYPAGIKNLINRVVEIAGDPKSAGKTITIFDEEITVKETIENLKKTQKIKNYPSNFFFNKTIFNFWRLAGRLLKRADLLIYLSLEK